MGEICFVAAVREQGAEQHLVEMAASLQGELADQFTASRAQHGVRDVRIWLQDAGSELRTIEAISTEGDPKQTIASLAAERSRVGEYIREQLAEAFGKDPREQLPSLEHLLRWSRTDSELAADLAYAIRVGPEHIGEIKQYSGLLEGNRAFGDMLASSGLDSLSLWLQAIDTEHAYLVVLLRGEEPQAALAHPVASNDPISRWIREKAATVVEEERVLFEERPQSKILFSWTHPSATPEVPV